MKKTTFYIPAWEDLAGANSVKRQLLSQGVEEGCIKFVTEKITRAITLNRAIRECETPYMGILDDDVMIADNAVFILESLLDKYANVGLAIAPVQQAIVLSKPKGKMPENSADEDCLENHSNSMWTLNCVIYRKDCGAFFEEDYFGSQILDWDFGLTLLHKEFLSVADRRTAVMHLQTIYDKKNLCYHGVVSRNRHIFMEKWKDINNWKGIVHFNETAATPIPTIEELTHSSEKWLMDYISQYDPYGMINCWYLPRFGTEENRNNFINEFETNYMYENKQRFNPYITDTNSIPVFE